MKPATHRRSLAIAGLLAFGLGGLAWFSTRASVPLPTATTTDLVQQALTVGKPTVVEFGSNVCTACREMKPVLAALRREHGARVAVVEIDLLARKEFNYLRRYRIQLMPTQIFFDAKGRETGRNMGKIGAEEILDRLAAAGTGQ
jgi:thioredoxin 1